MKVKAILVCVALVAGLLLASCSASSKNCPAYGKADVEEQEIVIS